MGLTEKTQKSPKFPQIEDALSRWLSANLNNGNSVSDAQLQEKALEYAQSYGLRNEFQASNGWISKFKNRHQFRSGESQGVSEVSLQVNPQSVPIGTTVIPTQEHSNFSNTVSLPPNSHYSSNPSIATSSRTNGTNMLINASSSQHYLPYGAGTSTPLVTSFPPSRMYPLNTITPSIPENAAFIFCDYQNDVVGMFQTTNILNQFLVNSKTLFQEVHQAKQKKNISSFSVGLSFRPGYPEVSTNNRYIEKLRNTGRLTEGNKGAEFIDGMIPREDDIVIKKRRIDAFYNTDLQMILQLRNIRHIILSGIATGDVILSTCRSAADRDLNVTVVRECCFDGNESIEFCRFFFLLYFISATCMGAYGITGSQF
ncbi:unnamed protein product [Rhizophagus irregularis]|nr:unnamed protein product [Rhizophagus irregularis]